MQETTQYIEEANQSMQETRNFLKKIFSKIHAGKANPEMIQDISVLYYGKKLPIKQLAAINTPDARTFVIKPFDRNTLQEIKKSIQKHPSGLQPKDDGESITINLPALTEERRKEFVKQIKIETENIKVRIRNIRKNVKEQFKHLQKNGTSEDVINQEEKKLQHLTDDFIAKITQDMHIKEKEILTL